MLDSEHMRGLIACILGFGGFAAFVGLGVNGLHGALEGVGISTVLLVAVFYLDPLTERMRAALREHRRR